MRNNKIGAILAVLVFVSTIIATSGCKKCIICTVKDANRNKVLYISPEKCGSETEFTALQDSLNTAYYCWGCAVYDSAIYAALQGSNESVRLDSSYFSHLDSLPIDTLDSINCGSVAYLDKKKNLTGILLRNLYGNTNLFVKCDNSKFPTKTECD